MGPREPPALGPRGEGWVAIQAALLAVLLAAGVLGPQWPDAVERPALALGLAVGIPGAVLLLGGALRLGAQLTPYPRPVEGGSLREGGVYGLVRHPIYGGVMLLSLAWSLATSWLALGPAVLLAVLFELKSRREELWLAEHHEGYGAYRERVRRRFIPWVW
ncbi:MAG: protein-S-isoprenylcysteine methyltransferase [Actinomycetota bacterium]|nr:MAG: protein-S-isoprenylcysteine methyltransferase [Actinomycetota bacterium]